MTFFSTSGTEAVEAAESATEPAAESESGGDEASSASEDKKPE